jgi:hypothetical protein
VRGRTLALKREQKIGALTLAYPFRWRLRNVGVRDRGLPDAGASISLALEERQR